MVSPTEQKIGLTFFVTPISSGLSQRPPHIVVSRLICFSRPNNLSGLESFRPNVQLLLPRPSTRSLNGDPWSLNQLSLGHLLFFCFFLIFLFRFVPLFIQKRQGLLLLAAESLLRHVNGDWTSDALIWSLAILFLFSLLSHFLKKDFGAIRSSIRVRSIGPLRWMRCDAAFGDEHAVAARWAVIASWASSSAA
ncbi:hypothetical protein IWX90DRAFT_274798 [Phyllosticta citrichinensis]|uniref:Uncharacterized protein n=1 Tax=Phyllosticta citrichinensis TaxID=1130410 RepID=A0ABR1XN73_9PEZI